MWGGRHSTDALVWLVIVVGVLLILGGCQHNDGWTQDEIDWINQNIPAGVHVNP